MFFGTNYHSVIKPLDICLASAEGPSCEPVLCGEYIAAGYAWQGTVNAGESTASEAATRAGADYAEFDTTEKL